MEMQRFDALARHLSQGGSRRRLLGLFGGTAFGSLIAAGLANDAEAKKRKNKKKCKNCGECQTCRKGKCKAKPDGTACSLDFCAGGACVCPEGFKACRGTCIASADCCTSADCPAGSGQTCQGGACACPPDQEDSGGVCGTRPTCATYAYGCAVDSECCSNDCENVIGFLRCACSDVGQACAADTDCCSGATCRGFVCRVA